jgi:FkbM family methyltransferase
MSTTTVIWVANVQVELLDDGDAIVRMTNNKKLWEPETRACWHSLRKEGELVIDVGAYTGIYSIASALMGSKVLAFEPHPTNFIRLKKNAAINSAKIGMLPLAASDRIGLMHLVSGRKLDSVSDTASVASRLHKPNIGGDVVCVMPVMAKRLDDVEGPCKVCLIKIDVEGHECEVIMGARNMIMRHRPLIVVEVLSQAQAYAVECLMQTMRYRCRHTMDKRNRLYAPD